MVCFIHQVNGIFHIRAWTDGKSDSEDTDSGGSDEEEEDENNSTDTDSLPKQSSLSKNGKDLAVATANTASLQFNAVQPNFYQEIGGQNSSSFQIQINLPPQAAPNDGDKPNNGQQSEIGVPPTMHHINDNDDYDT